MNKLRNVLTEITELTNTIETKYPELYQFLDENPMTLSTKNRPELDQDAFQEYLESLRTLLGHYLETHQNKAKEK